MGRPPAAGLMAAGGTLGVRNGGGEYSSLGGIRVAVGTIESFKNLIHVRYLDGSGVPGIFITPSL